MDDTRSDQQKRTAEEEMAGIFTNRSGPGWTTVARN